jgi:CubicO group peptidase (beta-lactamase class C family)
MLPHRKIPYESTLRCGKDIDVTGRIARLSALMILALAFSCSPRVAVAPPPLPPLTSSREISQSFGTSTPEEQGIDADGLVDVTKWILNSDLPIFSLLISRNGKLVYEAYTSGLGRDEAHYLMSVTKTFTSALVGIAIDKKLLPGPDTTVAELLPARAFASEADRARFTKITFKEVLAMSALDAQVPPHLVNDESRARQKAFLAAKNRATFALTQATLPEPGRSYQYTDITPLIATGALEYATNERAFDFAMQNLFGPLGFENAEWMHEDATGIDNGAYGIRLRPIDMQKFGVLFLDGGTWNGAQLISHEWVEQSMTPWIASNRSHGTIDYGWYWWQFHFGPWVGHCASGWKGQRIAVVREEKLVVTMTADIPDNREGVIFQHAMEHVRDAVKANAPLPPNAAANARLADALAKARLEQRIPSDAEPRMIPQVAPKERHHPFNDSGTSARQSP